jgi:hypothetical protein
VFCECWCLEWIYLFAGLSGNEGKRCIGIDNFSEFGGPRDAFLDRFASYKGASSNEFHEMSYRQYFERHHKGEIGVYIYDGQHDYENQMKGLQIAEPFFAKGTIVFVDDINDDAPYSATCDFLKKNPARFKVVYQRRTSGNCHPTFWNGIMVIQCC